MVDEPSEGVFNAVNFESNNDKCEFMVSVSSWKIVLAIVVIPVLFGLWAVNAGLKNSNTNMRLNALEQKVLDLEQENNTLLAAITDPALYKTWVERADDYGKRLDAVEGRTTVVEQKFSAAITRMRETLNPIVVDPDAVAEAK